MPSSRPSTADKRKTFRKLHESGCFVIPNPWNVGSARYLEGLGFKALATTSSGHAHSQGFADGDQSMDEVLDHYRELAAATDVPLNADFENGYAHDPDKVAENVFRTAQLHHGQILAAIEAGDPDAAERHVAAHIEVTRTDLIRIAAAGPPPA